MKLLRRTWVLLDLHDLLTCLDTLKPYDVKVKGWAVGKSYIKHIDHIANGHGEISPANVTVFGASLSSKGRTLRKEIEL